MHRKTVNLRAVSYRVEKSCSGILYMLRYATGSIAILCIWRCHVHALKDGAGPLGRTAAHERAAEERESAWESVSIFFVTKKCYNSQTKKTKLNSDCTIKFVSINSLKLDLTLIYLDKVTSGSTMDRE
jgi:hypothetical protein